MEALVTLLSVSATLTGSATFEPTSPNETVAGSTVAVVFTAAPASSLPAPAAVMLAMAPLSKTWFDAVFTSADLIELLNKAGVPSGPIYAIDQMFADPQVKHVRMAQPVKKSKLTLVGQPFTLSRTPSKLDAPPPECGQHTGAVLKQLGYSAKQIAALRKANAI